MLSYSTLYKGASKCNLFFYIKKKKTKKKQKKKQNKNKTKNTKQNKTK